MVRLTGQSGIGAENLGGLFLVVRIGFGERRACAGSRKPSSADSSEPASVPILAASTSAASAGKGQRADEQAHREADPAQQSPRPIDWRQLVPRGIGARPERTTAVDRARTRRPACRRTGRAGCASGSGCGERVDPAAKRDARRGEAEQGHDAEHHPGMDGMLEAPQRRVRLRLRRAGRSARRDAGDRRHGPRWPASAPTAGRSRGRTATAAAPRTGPSRPSPHATASAAGERHDGRGRRCRRRR